MERRSVPFDCLLVLLASLLLVSCEGSERTKDHCVVGAAQAKHGNYQEAHLIWRLVASDASQKAWLKATLDCLRGTGLIADERGAAAWLSSAAKVGDTDALVQLGLMHLNGLGVEKDLATARKLLLQAEDRGNESASFLLMKMQDSK